MNLFYQPLIPDGVHHLDEEESRHCVKVLRRRIGDALSITDGCGSLYEAVITSASPNRCEFRITATKTSAKKNHYIHIALSPTKNNDRIEWFTEKATEFGVDRITLFNSKHTERNFVKTDRLLKVAVSAMKQSLNTFLPDIQTSRDFSSVVATAEEHQKYIAYVDLSNPVNLFDVAKPDSSYLVLIGPEGDFATEELELAITSGFTKVSLGQSRLRTETAALAACHILNLVNR